MKYWRGYLVGGIIAVLTLALQKFAETHAALVDMFYPYVTRMMQSFLTTWSSGVDFCIWQVLLIALVVLALVSVVLMFLFKWNPVQWFGWVLAAVSVVFMLHTSMYGLNRYAGPLSEDIRMQEADYTITELKTAAKFFRDRANTLAEKLDRDAEGNLLVPEFSDLAENAGKGFQVLTREKFDSVFAGSVEPVKQLGWSKHYAGRGVGGKLVPLTGEAAVNPLAPDVYLPYGMCEQMARRMSIAVDRDAHFAAFLACFYHPDALFRYSGYLAAYQYCELALDAVAASTGNQSVLDVKQGINGLFAHDLQTYRNFFGTDREGPRTADLLVSWHIQEFVLPLQQEEEVTFDPLDESQVDLSGLPYAPESAETTEAAEE